MLITNILKSKTRFSLVLLVNKILLYYSLFNIHFDADGIDHSLRSRAAANSLRSRRHIKKFKK